MIAPPKSVFRRVLIGLAILSTAAFGSDDWWSWWPAQAPAKGLVQVPREKFSRTAREAENVMVQSLAGLAAQAVNEGRSDELVWNGLADSESYQLWLSLFIKRTQPEDRGSLSPWDLAARLTRAGVVRGYILYTPDPSAQTPFKKRPDIDVSINAATTMAGLLGGILVTPEMEPQARALGLSLLCDARGKDERWAFDQARAKLNPRYLLLQDPQMANMRDLAIAHRVATIYSTRPEDSSLLPEVLAWMKPMGTVWGWGNANESEFVGPISKAGHMIVPSDWSMNLPVLSSGRAELKQTPLSTPPAPAEEVARLAKEPCVSYLGTDGDNLQWMMGGFAVQSEFWANPDREKIPYGWTTCLGDLYLMVPDEFAYLRQTQPRDSSLVTFAGYFYPDLFAQDLGPERRKELLRQCARQIGAMMKATGCRLFTFIAMEIENDAAREVYQIFAEEIPDMLAAFIVKYSPYEAGEGKVYWAATKNGKKIPFISARYAIRANLKPKFPKAAAPARLAELINTDANLSIASGEPLAVWSTIHAWSGFFPEADGQEPALHFRDYKRGDKVSFSVATAARSAARLAPNVSVVNPETLAQIIRWREQQNPSASQARK